MKVSGAVPGHRWRLGRSELLALIVLVLGANLLGLNFLHKPQRFTKLPLNYETTLARCRALHVKPAPPPSFCTRKESDRFQPGTRPVLLKNATIWTGGVDGLEVLKGDIFMNRGIIVATGVITKSLLDAYEHDVVDVEGAWVTPGIVDVHAHLGVGASPQLDGADDANSIKGLVLPWMRSVDAINTHDEGYALAVAGGVTTSLILPGSADAMGGQAFAIKLRPTEERSSSSLLLEPPFGLNGSDIDYSLPPRWRHMKHACGENPARVYGGTRMDTVWSVRKAYDDARKIKIAQDKYCEQALGGRWTGLGEFPAELASEALVDILRGKTKVQTHCYEAVDLDAFIRLSNEFQFPVASFHHAHESYLVPEVLKHGYGSPPASAIFSTFSRYKREAYRHSEFAAGILANNGLKVIMKSDHPAIVSRYLIHEARIAHYYGLENHLALASVISTPAEIIGLDHRVGFIKPGYDADIVVWDSHPLALAATPTQVYIDGIAQLTNPHIAKKPASQQHAPKTPNFDKERMDTIKYEGLPPLEPTRVYGTVLFRNISSFWMPGETGVHLAQTGGNVLVRAGVIDWAASDAELDEDAVIVDLHGGSISPALVSAGSTMGLQEIAMESSTADGAVFDPLSMMELPSILGDQFLMRAVDGLQFGTRDALLAYRGGVASAISAPAGSSFLQGLSVSFSLGARHKLEKGAILQDVTAVHVSLSSQFASSVSTQIAVLRRLLLEPRDSSFRQASHGSIPLVVTVHSADIISSLIQLKQEVESKRGSTMKMTIMGAAEAHLLAAELGAAGVGVIQAPPRSYPYDWEHRRMLAGPPLTAQSSAAVLASHNVTVGLGPQGINAMAAMSNWAVRSLRFDMAWVALESGGSISNEAALSMASSNIQKLLGIPPTGANTEYAVTAGGDIFSLEAKVVAMVSPRRGVVDLF
ncbi:hypothetical protein FB45DRAFT_888386 [Roridomyces roridus]|uniref:Amidohydrolase-related domain-containing protein n=1 Tax=Roridomyces roridus TaxID=1738132 RepID=A0AAD7FZ16_9AGAR|nr:hypothetical protein FB45DRAFT_888386 [Roridomyces roridus]